MAVASSEIGSLQEFRRTLRALIPPEANTPHVRHRIVRDLRLASLHQLTIGEALQRGQVQKVVDIFKSGVDI